MLALSLFSTVMRTTKLMQVDSSILLYHAAQLIV